MTAAKGHVFTQVALLVPNGHDLLGYPALKVVRLVAFEDVARKLARTLRKGDTVKAEGAVKFERWNDKEGYQRTCLTVIASKVEKIAAAAVNIFSARPGGKSLAEYQLAADTRVAERVAAQG
jgi:single-stranded DNA-binding protein